MKLQDVKLAARHLDVAKVYNYNRYTGGEHRLLPWPFPVVHPGTLPGTMSVVAYQVQLGLTVDGKLGPNTEKALRELAPYVDIGGGGSRVTGVTDEVVPLEWVRVPADQYDGRGYDSFQMRADAAAAFKDARTLLGKCGVKVTTSGGKRSLRADVSANRSATSMHYLGRAFDLYVYSGMTDPDDDPFIVELEDAGKRLWRVWAKCSDPSAIPQRYTGRPRIAAIWEDRKGGYAIEDDEARELLDFTRLMADIGFARIPARKSFFKGGSRGGAEWWHFQYEAGLKPGITRFGDELLRVYPESKLKGTAPWEYRDYVWNGSYWKRP